ncbi:unnamed protein product [Cochlearia groenlandica]
METSKTTNLQNPKLTNSIQHHIEEKQEETLSILDLPLTTEKPDSTTVDHREQSNELFEFLTSASNDVSPAENIIFAGKLIPLNYQNALFSPPEHISPPRIRARSESLSAIQGKNLNTPMARDNASIKLMRTSRSLDYRKLTRGSTNTVHSPPKPRKTTTKTETASCGDVKSLRRPRWYVIMFGMVKFTPEIELKDIKNRQIRRNIIPPPVIFPSPVNRRNRSPSPSWRFLDALSCKEPTSVAATAPVWLPYA